MYEGCDELKEDFKLLQNIKTFIYVMNYLSSEIKNTYDYQKIVRLFHNNYETHKSEISTLIKNITSNDISDIEFPKNLKGKENKEVKKNLEDVKNFIKSKLIYGIDNYWLLLMKYPNDIENVLHRVKHEGKKWQDLDKNIKQEYDKLSEDKEMIITQNLKYFQR